MRGPYVCRNPCPVPQESSTEDRLPKNCSLLKCSIRWASCRPNSEQKSTESVNSWHARDFPFKIDPFLCRSIIQEDRLYYLKRNSPRRMFGLSLLLLLVMALTVVACSDSSTEEAATAVPAATETPVPAPSDPTEVSQQAPTPTEEPADMPAPTVEATETPAPADTPIPTAAPTEEPTATPEPVAQTYPLEIMDMMGRPVTISSMPMRIVSVSPTATELLYAAGGTAVARDTGSIYPVEVLDLPEIGGAYQPSFEAIAAQRPDLILVEALTQARFLEPLSQFGAPVVAVRATSLVDITAGINLLGQILEQDEMAEQAAQEIAARVSSATEGLSGGKSALILISDADRNLYVAKPQSYPGAIASMVKLSNPAADLPDSGTFPGFAIVSAEQLLAMDPDFLFTITPAPEPAPRLSAMLPRIPGFANLRAIRSGQMHEIDHVILLRNQGPRIAEAVEAMAELVGGAP